MMHIQAPMPGRREPARPAAAEARRRDHDTCLQKSPQARFPGMRALLAALDEIERVTDRRGWRTLAVELT